MKWRNLLFGVFVLMAIGSPDNSNVNRPALTKASVDLNEVSARLGSKSVMERGGELLWQDSFGQGLAPYELTPDAFGSIADISPLSSPSSGYSLRVITAVNANARYAIDKLLPFTNLNVFGFEIRFAFTNYAEGVYTSIHYTKNQIKYQATIAYKPTASQLFYLDNTANYVLLDTLAPAIVNRKFYYFLKFQVDTNNNVYENVFFNSNKYSLKGIPLYQQADAFLDNMMTHVLVVGNASGSYTVNLGDWIVTRNEILQ